MLVYRGMDVGTAKPTPAERARVPHNLTDVAEPSGRFSTFAASWAQYPPERVRVAGIRMTPEVTKARVEARVAAMIERGLLEEVRRLLERGFGGWVTSTQAIGYAEMAEHLEGR